MVTTSSPTISTQCDQSAGSEIMEDTLARLQTPGSSRWLDGRPIRLSPTKPLASLSPNKRVELPVHLSPQKNGLLLSSTKALRSPTKQKQKPTMSFDNIETSPEQKLRDPQSHLLGSPVRRIQLSHQKQQSPAKRLGFCVKFEESAKNVSFTPEKKNVPRAWERRPATPFVPRDDKQKIWKRMPLGELGIEVSVPEDSLINKNTSTKPDYTRIVKKLKIGHTGADNTDNKENIFAGKMIGELGGDRDTMFKRGSTTANAWSVTRSEEDGNIKTPRRKTTRPDHPTFQHDGKQEVKLDHHRGRSSDEVSAENEGPNERQGDLPEIKDDSSNTSEIGTDSDIETADTMPTNEKGADVAIEQHAQSAATDGDSEIESIVSGSEDSIDSSISSVHEDIILNRETTESVQDFISEELLDEDSSKTKEQDGGKHVDLSSNDLMRPVLSESEAERKQTTEDVLRDKEKEQDHFEFSFVVEASPHPQGKRDEREGQPLTSEETEETIQESEDKNTILPSTSRRVSEQDEIAFLHAFLSRSQEQRAQRGFQQETSSQESVELIPISAKKDPSSTDIVHETSTEVQTSPLRRSKRGTAAVINSQPQVQTIQLKLRGATGNEFIFRANTADSQANIVLKTKQNTKKNKAESIPVLARLEQLKHSATDHSQYNQDTTDEKGAKKRKCKEKEMGQNEKVRKTLKWNDEQLATYTEVPARTLEEVKEGMLRAVREAQLEATAGFPPEANIQELAGIEKKCTGNEAAFYLDGDQGSNLVAVEDAKDQISGEEEIDRQNIGLGATPSASTPNAKPVRRGMPSRRGITGGVNGTPAPKQKRHQGLLQQKAKQSDAHNSSVREKRKSIIQNAIEEQNSVTQSAAASEAIKGLSTETATPLPDACTETAIRTAETKTKVVKKSRMPVPQARITATATAVTPKSESIRIDEATASKSRTRQRAEREVAKEKEEKKDLLGARRLRIRE